MPVDLWLTFVAASTALLLIPGPTVLLVLSYALSKGRSVAVASAAGVALGDLTAMSLSLAGLGALVMASATLFTALKWIGAAYLVWLGIALFLLGMAGLGVTMWPDIVPGSIDIWEAAAPERSQVFMLIGVAITMPLILIYTGWAYWVFRGKVGHEGYH